MSILRTENISPGIRAGYLRRYTSQGRHTERAQLRARHNSSQENIPQPSPEASVEDDNDNLSRKLTHCDSKCNNPAYKEPVPNIGLRRRFYSSSSYPSRVDIVFDAWLEPPTLITPQGHTSAPHKIYRKCSGRLVSSSFHLRREQHVRISAYGYDN